MGQLRALPAYDSVDRVIYRRSFPFFKGERYRPDLRDLFRLFDDVKLVISYRDPRASTASSLRRAFGPNLRACAVVVEEQLTYIAAQLSTLDPSSYLLTRYEDFVADPDSGIRRMAKFCEIDETALLGAARAEGVQPGRNDRWASELTETEVAFLDEFFDAQRRRQWQLLAPPVGAKVAA